MKFKVGDLVRNTYEHFVIKPRSEGLGIVLEIINKNIAGHPCTFPQLKVATAQGITYWWPAVTELTE
jgi:hypothetical protein